MAGRKGEKEAEDKTRQLAAFKLKIQENRHFQVNVTHLNWPFELWLTLIDTLLSCVTSQVALIQSGISDRDLKQGVEHISINRN